MARAAIVKELLIKTPDKIGMLAEVAGIIAKSGANITAINAFGVEKDAIFRIITSDNASAIKEFKAKKYNVSEKEVVKLELENKPGMARVIGKKIKAADIDIKYIYATACLCECGCGCECALIFNTSNNKKAVNVLNKTLC